MHWRFYFSFFFFFKAQILSRKTKVEEGEIDEHENFKKCGKIIFFEKIMEEKIMGFRFCE